MRGWCPTGWCGSAPRLATAVSKPLAATPLHGRAPCSRSDSSTPTRVVQMVHAQPVVPNLDHLERRPGPCRSAATHLHRQSSRAAGAYSLAARGPAPIRDTGGMTSGA